MNTVDSAAQRRIVRDVVTEAADPFIFSRGKRYARDGHVAELSDAVAGNLLTIEGIVKGSRRYRTTLVVDTHAKSLRSYVCSCPYEDFCKHVVALGLAYADVSVDSVQIEARKQKVSVKKKQKPFHERYDVRFSVDYRERICGVMVEKRQEHRYWYSLPESGAKALLREETELTDKATNLLRLIATYDARPNRYKIGRAHV